MYYQKETSAVSKKTWHLVSHRRKKQDPEPVQNPDLSVSGTDPPILILTKMSRIHNTDYWYGSGSFHHQTKKKEKNLDFYCSRHLYDFLS
jgi:hypothetical protein